MISGTDVESLYPSLRDIEAARITREAVLTSGVQFENIDYIAALRYLYLVGGKDHLCSIGLKNLVPKWLGKRPDLLTLGGEALTEEKKWAPMRRCLLEKEKKIIISRVVEAAVIICMNSHVYSFGEKIYIQVEGGPIGMRFTASLANVVMKMWDKKWVELMEEAGLEFDLFLRYVDDCRLFLPAINKGWVWEGDKFTFKRELMLNDEENDAYTTREITKAMCSLVGFLKFTGEECGMFTDKKLPTLDTSLWVKDGRIEFQFYEKPTVGNMVLQKETALPVSSLRASLLQETVRRLINTSPKLDTHEY